MLPLVNAKVTWLRLSHTNILMAGKASAKEAEKAPRSQNGKCQLMMRIKSNIQLLFMMAHKKQLAKKRENIPILNPDVNKDRYNNKRTFHIQSINNILLSTLKKHIVCK